MVTTMVERGESKYRRYLNDAEVTSFAEKKYRPSYSPTQLKRLGKYHQLFAIQHNISNPYFEQVGNDEPYKIWSFPDGTILKVGSISSFTAAEMAAFLETQMYLYVEKETMGHGFPNRNKTTEDELRKIMMADFYEDRDVVLLYKIVDGRLVPLAGVQAYPGTKTDRTIGEYLTNQVSNDTSLSPFWANVVNVGAAEVQAFIRKYACLKEDNIVVMSRLFNQFGAIHKQAGSEQREAPWLVMAALAEGIKMRTKKTNKTVPKIVLYDTHTREIQNQLVENFGMQILANEENVQPSAEVGETILKWHYGMQEWEVKLKPDEDDYTELVTVAEKKIIKLDSYAGEILIGYHDFEAYLERAQQMLQAIEEVPV